MKITQTDIDMLDATGTATPWLIAKLVAIANDNDSRIRFAFNAA